jgi:hypothetical protein
MGMEQIRAKRPKGGLARAKSRFVLGVVIPIGLSC